MSKRAGEADAAGAQDGRHDQVADRAARRLEHLVDVVILGLANLALRASIGR